jgi:hypothetical protein
VPKKLGVIGSGVIGLEMGSVWRRLGAEVTVLEGLPTFLGAVDERGQGGAKVFTKQGLKIELGVKMGEVKAGKKGVSVAYTNAKGEAVARGRQAHRLHRPRAQHHRPERRRRGPEARRARRIVVDGDCRTNLPGVWAVGDVVRGPMLAHKAEEEGVAVAERMAGQHGHVNFNTIPWVIYTSPEIAWVGQTEQQLKAAGRGLQGGQFPFLANGRARALGDTTGMVKLLADARPTRSWACTSSARRQRADRRRRGGDGVQGQCRGHRAHLPRPPVAERSHQGSRAGGGQAHAELLSAQVSGCDHLTGLRGRRCGRGYTADAGAAAGRGGAAALRGRVDRLQGAARQRLTKMLVKPQIPRGVYMYGGVGRGKSFLMDCFFQAVPLQRKTRLHFHEFMREVHRELQELKGTPTRSTNWAAHRRASTG